MKVQNALIHNTTDVTIFQNEFLTAVLDSSPVAQFIIDLNNHVLYWNKAASNLYGWETSKVIGKPLPIIPEYLYSEFQKHIDSVLKNNAPLHTAFIFSHHNSIHFQTDISISPIPIGTSIIGFTISVTTDSLYHLTEQNVAASNYFSSKIIEAIADGFSVLDCNGVQQEVNPAFCKMTGYSREELIGKSPPYPYWPKEEFQNIQAAFNKTLTGTFSHFELVFKRKNNERFPVIVSPSQIFDNQGNIISYIATVKDISKIKNAENELKLNELRLESLNRINHFNTGNIQQLLDFALSEAIALTNSTIGYIYFYDEKNKLFSLNTWSKEVMHLCTIAEPQTTYHLEKTGIWGEAVRQRCPIVINDFSAPNPLKKSVPKGHAALHKFLTIPVFYEDTIVAVVGVANKQTDYNDSDTRQLTLMMDAVWQIVKRKEVEDEQASLREQAAHSRKMEAIGQLAGGIAHDFNNILSGITGFTDLLLLNLNDTKESEEIIQRIADCTVKAASLTNQLLMFARKGSINIIETDANKSLLNIANILQRTIDKRITISLSLEADPCTISVDIGQFESALLNLAINARDSMPKGGNITLHASTKHFNTLNQPDVDFTVKDGTYRCISVSDNGSGIDKHILPHIFEPFFTTKNPGMGTGLGLAGVYGFVKKHFGYIDVKSEIGSGSTFTIYIPAALETKPQKTGPVSNALVKGSGKIMIIDDDTDLRDSSSRILNALGYITVTFCNGKEAIEYFRDHAEDIDLILLDVNMPILNGIDCFRELQKIRPSLKVIVTTGVGECNNFNTMRNKGVVQILKKPYNFHILSQTISDILKDSNKVT